MRRLFIVLLGTILVPGAWAVGVHHIGQARTQRGLGVPYAHIRVCQAGVVGTPCPTLVTIYSDHNIGATKSNPFDADSLGNYDFYAPAGEYQIQISATGIVTQTQDWVPLSSPVGGGGGGGSSTTRFAWFQAAGSAGTTSSLGYDILPTGGMTTVSANGTNVGKGMGRFANSGTPSGQAHIFLSGTTSMSTDIVLLWTTSVASGTATWQLGAVCTLTNGSATDDPAFLNYWNPSAATASGTPNTLNLLTVSATNLPAGCANNTYLHLRIKRIDTVGTAVNADLVGFGITFH